MEQYRNYAIRDFINDEHFIRWVKYPDAHSNAYWGSVRTNFPYQSSVMDRAAGLVRAFSEFYPDVPETEIAKGRQAILEQLPVPGRSLFDRKRLYLSIAASVTLLIGVALWYNSSERPAQLARNILNQKPGIETANEGAAEKRITLTDGSTITLSPLSKVRYDMDASDRREIYLEGEAFFNVSKNPRRPFYVFVNGLTTKVLGTRFKVSAYPNGTEVKVEVVSGRVRVYSSETAEENRETAGLTLTPNQSAVYNKKDQQITRNLVAQPKVLVTQEQLRTYNYTDTPISKVFDGLEEIYGVRVIYDQEKFKNCRLNMSLSDESLFEKLELIGKMVEARYNIQDGEVIFIGEGCTE